jgi:hypothetical protein
MPTPRLARRAIPTRALSRAYVQKAPERLVWGGDWPHPSERDNKPDDAILFDLLLD